MTDGDTLRMLADAADGFGGGGTAEHKLDIMRDSRIGTYGVLALIFAMLLKVLALASLVSATGDSLQGLAALVAVSTISRSFMTLMMQSLPPARSDGRSAEAGTPSQQSARNALGMGLVTGLPIMWLSFGWWEALGVTLAGAVAYVIVKRISARQIGGQTGDVLGAMQLLREVDMLMALAVSLG